MRGINPFDTRSPHCNKIAGALNLSNHLTQGFFVLTDSDVVIFEDPRSISVPADQVGMKLVDAPNPPRAVLESIFNVAGLAIPDILPLPWMAGESTVRGNGNGGLYLVPGPLLAKVSGAWSRWALWLLDRSDLMDEWAVHVDQVAMALALAAEGIGVLDLDPRWNVPTHISNYIPANTPLPAMLHYHQEVDQTGQLKKTGIAVIDGRIEDANDALSEVLSECFPNETFWDWRYLTNPELGSGLGSRGAPLEAKRLLLSQILTILTPTSLLDIGCGDGEATVGLPIPAYVGVDLSREAVRIAQQGRPTGQYYIGTILDYPGVADLTLCLDVLIHQSNFVEYRDLVKRLMASANDALLVSGYEEPPSGFSPMVHFHERLSKTISEAEPEAEIYLLREEHQIVTLLVLKPSDKQHRNDLWTSLLTNSLEAGRIPVSNATREILRAEPQVT